MKVKIKDGQAGRPVKALLYNDRIYFKSPVPLSGCYFLDNKGEVIESSNSFFILESRGATPIYEGDTVEITF